MQHVMNPGMGGDSGFKGHGNGVGGRGITLGISTIHNAIGVSIKKTWTGSPITVNIICIGLLNGVPVRSNDRLYVPFGRLISLPDKMESFIIIFTLTPAGKNSTNDTE